MVVSAFFGAGHDRRANAMLKNREEGGGAWGMWMHKGTHWIFRMENVRCLRDPTRFSAFDLISLISKTPNPRTTWSYLISKYLTLIPFSMYKFGGRGSRHTPIILETHLKDFVMFVLTHVRISDTRRHTLMELFDIPVSSYLCKRSVEHNTLDIICDTFCACNPIRQYSVLNYRIDLYIKDLNVAIECDENNHQTYDGKREHYRQSVITSALNCTWVRYNPYKPGFRLGQIIYQIMLCRSIPPAHAHTRRLSF